MASEETDRVAEADAGMRLDKWLSARPSVGSRSKAKQALRSGKVSIGGRQVGLEQAGQALEAGTEITIAWARPGSSPERTRGRERLAASGVRILHSDREIVVADKPTGLLTDAADRDQRRNRDTLVKRLTDWLGQPVWPAHRIDRDTTGLVVFATSEPVRDALMAQWRARTPDRIYQAIVEGRVREDAGRWADWMAWDKGSRLQTPSEKGKPGAYYAEADWRVVQRLGRRGTVLEVRLVSGRRNQIRLQAMLRGHPLLGETLYRKHPGPETFARQALHAWRLAFDHPASGERMQLEAPLPPDMVGLIRRLRQKPPKESARRG